MTSPALQRGNRAEVRDQFTLQAHDFTTAQHATDDTLLAQYCAAIAPEPRERIVDFCAGPGIVAARLAPLCRHVILFDLTHRMLVEAARLAPSCARIEGAAEEAPLRDAVSDIAVCRLSWHHVPDPAAVLREMMRVVRHGGRIVVNDIVTSEDPAASARTEAIERLRDPSHTRCLTPAELVRVFLDQGVRITAIEPWIMTVDSHEWMDRVYPPETHRAQVHARLDALAGNDLGGMKVWRDGPSRLDGERLMISRRGIILCGVRP